MSVLGVVAFFAVFCTAFVWFMVKASRGGKDEY